MTIRNMKTPVDLLRTIPRNFFALFLIALLLFAAGPAGAQETPSRTVLRVGTTDAPPFAVKLGNGQWSGISIELWRNLAAGLGLRFELVERTLPELLAGLQDGSLDAGVTAITITADREKVMDFTHPFFVAGLATAVRSEGAALHWLHVAEKFLSLHFLYLIGALMLVLFVAGSLVWIFERRKNAAHFANKLPHGLGDGFWWAVVTMTTVGYGDRAPKSLGGRVVAIVWMFVSIIILSSFIAAITSSLTLSQLGASVQGLPDLKRIRVGSLKDSTGEAFLTGQDIESVSFGTTPSGLRALVDSEIDAFVLDAPILKYRIHSHYRGRLQVLPEVFDQQYYGIALPNGSNLREPLNRSLLLYIQSEDWKAQLKRYLGP
jgi:polar amino acid transport system substrate-binding protein